MKKHFIVIGSVIIALAVFAVAALLYGRQGSQGSATAGVEATSLVRTHSPMLGPSNAPVTIVEFFDPSCEACRAFYPITKQIMDRFPGDVRLVLRYTAFHQGSDQAVGILEAARLQGKFEPVLEALLEKQPQWAIHGTPDISKAWEAAAGAGLDVARAKADAKRTEVKAVLDQDMADVQTFKVEKTPTFFVNGKALPSFGAQELFDLVRSEVQAAKGSTGAQ